MVCTECGEVIFYGPRGCACLRAQRHRDEALRRKADVERMAKELDTPEGQARFKALAEKVRGKFTVLEFDEVLEKAVEESKGKLHSLATLDPPIGSRERQAMRDEAFPLLPEDEITITPMAQLVKTRSLRIEYLQFNVLGKPTEARIVVDGVSRVVKGTPVDVRAACDKARLLVHPLYVVPVPDVKGHPGMIATYTYALMEVSQQTFDEVKAKLKKADYGHALLEKGTVLDMHGVALVVGPAKGDSEGSQG